MPFLADGIFFYETFLHFLFSCVLNFSNLLVSYCTCLLFQEPFDPVNFVERVAAKIHGGGSKGGSDAFDPTKLKESFEDTIKSLQTLMNETEGRIGYLETECADEEKQHKNNSQSVEEQFKVFYWILVVKASICSVG